MEKNNYELDYSTLEDLSNFETSYKKDNVFLKDIECYIKSYPSLTLKYKNSPIALGGFVPAWDGVLTSWNIVSKEAKYHKKTVFMAIKEGFEAMLGSFFDNGYNITRLQSVVILSRPEAVKLNYILGFEPEAVLRKYDRLGNDCLIMSQIFKREKK